MSKRSILVLALVASLCMLMASGVLAGIGVYKIDATLSVPATITYMLNKAATSVTVDICPAANLNSPIRTIAGPTAKGMNTVNWDGKDGSGNWVPVGSYKAKITAVGAAVGTGASGEAMEPLWEYFAIDGGLAQNGWRVYGIAVNKNPNSQFYGHVFVGQQNPISGVTGVNTIAKGIYEFKPDGTLVGKFTEEPTWGGSAPWGLCVAEDDCVYVQDRTNSRVCRFYWDVPTKKWKLDTSYITGSSTGRGLGCTGGGTNLKLVATNHAPGNYYYTGGAAPIAAFTNSSTGSAQFFMQPAVASDGTIYIGSHASSTTEFGALTVFTTWGATIPAYNNGSITKAAGVALSPDGTTMWIGRTVNVGVLDPDDGGAAGTAGNAARDPRSVYKFNTANAAVNMKTSPPAEFRNYAVGTAYTTAPASTSYSKSPFNISADPVGNLAIIGGPNDIAKAGNYFGLYEEPTGVATQDTKVSSADMHFDGEPAPQFVSGNINPNQVPADGTTTVVATVVAQDADGGADIASAKITCAALGLTSVPMNAAVPSGTQRTFTLNVSVPLGTAVGAKTATIDIADGHAGVTVAHGTINFVVTGGFLSGRLLNGDTNLPAGNVRVKATLGTEVFEAVTDSDGNYSINATPGAGYAITPVTEADATSGTDITKNKEYNLYSNWPANTLGYDWPKTADAVLKQTTSVANGRVWPLAIRESFAYSLLPSGSGYKVGNREMSVVGIVMRQSADSATGQLGLNGYYFISDSRWSGTQHGLKVMVRPGDPPLKEKDKVVVDGTYYTVNGYGGHLVPSAAPVVLATNQAYPVERNFLGPIQSNLVGGYYKTQVTCEVIDPVGTDYFTINCPNEDPAATYRPIRVFCDTGATSGITSLPAVGELVNVMGITYQYGAFLTGILAGKPTDIKRTVTISSIGAIKALEKDTNVIFNIAADNPLIVTSAAPFDSTGNRCDWIYVEDSARTNGVKINGNGLLPAGLTIWPGDTVTTQLKGQLLQPTGDYELKLSVAPTIVESSDTSLVPKPIAVSNLAFGGGWYKISADTNGVSPAMFDRGMGVNNQGLYGKIYGRVTEIISETDPITSEQKPYIVFIDDGSAVKSGIAGTPVLEKTGVKCIVGKASLSDGNGGSFPIWAPQPATLSVGDYVVVTGIIGSEWIADPVGRMRVMRMRYCYDPSSGFPPTEFYDQFQIIEDAP